MLSFSQAVNLFEQNETVDVSKNTNQIAAHYLKLVVFCSAVLQILG